MDYFLLVLGILLVISGFIGCVIPVIPGPPLGYLGIIALHFTQWGPFTSQLLWILGFFAVAVTALDYIVPIWGTKKFGGSKAAGWGSTIGLIVGLFFPPVGIIVGPFLGAFVGELTQKKTGKQAFKAALGSLLGFLIGVGFKLIVASVIAYYFVRQFFM